MLIFSFELPRTRASLRVKVWRQLKKLGAKYEINSFWSLEYSKENTGKLSNLAKEILENGGKAEILEGRTLWKK